MKSAYKELTGEHAIFTCNFRPKTGEDWPRPWVEMKDYIFSGTGKSDTATGTEPTLQPVFVLPPPELESLRGLPNLASPSDHVALVADLEFA
mmetsp:Transcript_49082/g.111350  ORF Transcript_49082/g.111350 Transcript_49082/m.111350 type:complete len:92 (+) Transcript_49082:130-405(+)